MPFAALGLAEPLLRALRDADYQTPTPIQAAAIPPLLAGRDLLGVAQTGTGKTAAFALPILQRLAAAPALAGPRPIRALVLSPTRELAIQIDASFRSYGRHLRLNGTVIFGGVNQFRQEKALARGVDILVATPGRLLDLLQQRILRLDTVEIVVLDEADRMLDMGFIRDVRRICAALPRRRQTLLFSATMPGEIRALADDMLHDPEFTQVTPVASTVPAITQSVYHVETADKQALLTDLLRDPTCTRALVFTRTKHGADRVAKRLGRDGIQALAIHGNKSQNARQRALEAFRSGATRVLVASDLAARGLDVDEVSHVINVDLPHEPDTYVHRIGRTGRAGASGRAISMCAPDERPRLRAIEKLMRCDVPVAADHPLALPPPSAAAQALLRRAPASSPSRGRPAGGGRPGGGRAPAGRGLRRRR